MTAIVPKISFSFDKKCRSVYKFGLMSWTPRNISYFTLGHRLHDCHFFRIWVLGHSVCSQINYRLSSRFLSKEYVWRWKPWSLLAYLVGFWSGWWWWALEFGNGQYRRRAGNGRPHNSARAAAQINSNVALRSGADFAKSLTTRPRTAGSDTPPKTRPCRSSKIGIIFSSSRFQTSSSTVSSR